MRRNRTTTPAFIGQLLFAEVEADSIVLDCVLARTTVASPGAPVTLKANWPRHTNAREVTSVLRQWADEEAFIEVTIADGPRGPAVEITSDTTKVILTPDE